MKKPFAIYLTANFFLICFITPFVSAEDRFTRTVLFEDIIEWSSIATVDLDNDGDNDFLVSSEDHVPVWIENENGLEFTIHDIDTLLYRSDKILGHDLNNDGNQDILVFVDNWIIEDHRDALLYYENNGEQAFNRHELYTNFSYLTDFEIFDLDGDLDDDIITAASSSGVAWLENDGQEPPNFTYHLVSNEVVCHQSVEICDFNNDNIPDIITGNYYGEIYLFENDGNLEFELFELNQLMPNFDGSISQIEVVDMNNDNVDDIVATGDRNLLWGEYTGNYDGFLEHEIEMQMPGGRVRVIVVKDFDTDGDPDIVVNQSTRSINFYENNGYGTFISGDQIEDFDFLVDMCETDFDGDGDFDLVALTGTHEGIRDISLLTNNLAPPISISLQSNYFELISFSLYPTNLWAEDAFRDIPGLVIVYEDNGDIFQPDDINTIRGISLGEGYRVFCNETSTLTLTGVPTDPEREFSVSGGIWNWMGYPFLDAVPVTIALNEIVDLLSIVLTDDGRFWVPAIELNTIGEMQPGEGYFVFPESDIDFVFTRELMGKLAEGNQNFQQQDLQDKSIIRTGKPYLVLVTLHGNVEFKNVAAIEVYDGDILVGRATNPGGSLVPVVAWEAEPNLELPGFSNGHPITVLARNEAGEIIGQYDQAAPDPQNKLSNSFGEGAYSEISIKVNRSTQSLPLQITIGKGYPNPFNSTLTIPVSIPDNDEITIKLFNILGQTVFEEYFTLNAGHHRITLDNLSSMDNLVSGIYLLKLSTAGFQATQRVVFMK
ncbi:T9SS type A sorting domain-containing protein [bacterium]|nr:T9SS type A sorting domain-containing protein [bacterium]